MVTTLAFTFSRLQAMGIVATTRADWFTFFPMNFIALFALTNIDRVAETIRRTALRALWLANSCLSVIFISCLATAFSRRDAFLMRTFAPILTHRLAGTTTIPLVAFVAYALIIPDALHIGRAVRRTVWLASICLSVICISRLATACFRTYALLVVCTRSFAAIGHTD